MASAAPSDTASTDGIQRLLLPRLLYLLGFPRSLVKVFAPIFSGAIGQLPSGNIPLDA